MCLLFAVDDAAAAGDADATAAQQQQQRRLQHLQDRLTLAAALTALRQSDMHDTPAAPPKWRELASDAVEHITKVRDSLYFSTCLTVPLNSVIRVWRETLLSPSLRYVLRRTLAAAGRRAHHCGTRFAVLSQS
jgi:hypothetical protein